VKTQSKWLKKAVEAFYQTHGVHGNLDMKEKFKQVENLMLKYIQTTKITQPYDHQAQ
jgi:hypothetical protein